jgi:simple sugar transport system permease protein
VVLRREAAIFFGAVIVIAYFCIRNSNFYSYTNIVTIAQYIAPIVVIGGGEVLLLVLAEIDLSAGQTFLLSPWIVYLLFTDGFPLGWAIFLSLLCCLAVGAINGLFTVLLNVPSFVTTLGTYFAMLGLVLIESGDEQADMPGNTGNFGQAFGISSWSEIGWALAIVGVLWFVLKKTRFGVHVIATGGNPLGAAEAGIRTRRIKVWCFMILALGAGFIGILDSIRIGSLDPAAPGTQEMFLAVSAAVIGGTALTGGRGTVLGTIIGAIVLGTLEDGFNLIGVSANAFILCEGLVILGLMAINVQLNKVITRKGGR